MAKKMTVEINSVAVEWNARSTDWRESRRPGDLYEDLKVELGDDTNSVVDLGEYANQIAGKCPLDIEGSTDEEFEAWLKRRNGVIRNVQREVLKQMSPEVAKSTWVPTCSNSGKGCCCSPHFIVRNPEFRGRSGWIKGTVKVDGMIGWRKQA
jgi:hypothetical protein